MSGVGDRARPLDWDAITSGRFRYTADVDRPDLLHAKILRSPHPHARILELDVSAAREAPGVCAVITAADFPLGARYQHEGALDRPPMAEAEVRFVGQEVAAVAAETAAQAEAALRRVKVRYRTLPAPLDVAEALNERAPQLHARATGRANVSVAFERAWGDVAGGAAAVERSVAGLYRYPAQCHACMEPAVTLAEWSEAEQRLSLWTSTAAPFYVVREVARVLGLDEAQVICREVGVGGSFGARSKVGDHEAIAALLSRRAGRPVLLELAREEDFSTTKTRHAFETTLRLGEDASHRLRLIEGEVTVDNGAFNHSGGSVTGAGVKGLGTLYEPDGLKVAARLVDTAKRPGGQFRGYGSTQTGFALECLADELAWAGGCDPLDWRLLNANSPNSRTLSGALINSCGLTACLEAAAEAIGWREAKAQPVRGEGLGIASAVHVSGSYAEPNSNRSDAALDLYADGRARLRFGGGDAGTGQKTILAQIVAEELGLPLERISVLSMDSDHTPFDMGAWSSRGTHYTGHAARQAARAAADALRELAAARLGGSEILLQGGRATGPLGGIALGELAMCSPRAADSMLSFEASYVEPRVERSDPATGQGNVSASQNFAAHAARVRVDWRTGQVAILDYVAAHDVGRAMNPTLVEGQIVGGTAMGLGAALGEEVILEQGRMVNAAHLHYALPRAADLPPIRAIIVPGADVAGPYGAKGVGETGVNPPAAVISNAIRDATGVRLNEPPFTPDKVLTALGLKQRRFGLWRRPARWWTALVRWAYPRGLFKVLHTAGRRWPKPGPHAPITAVVRPADLTGLREAAVQGATPLGGGTDLHLRRRLGLAAPARLAYVGDVVELNAIARTAEGGWRIGAGVQLAKLAEALRESLPVLAAAIDQIASPQIREVATLGGALLQTNRCWFLRNGFDCYKRRGGLAPCYAILGDHRFFHAAIDGERCQSVTPADLAGVLTALRATAVAAPASGGERRIPLSELYVGPGETVLGGGDILVAVEIPPPPRSRQFAYRKLRLWEGDFAIASLTLAADVSAEGDWSDLELCFGGLAPVPWRALETARRLEGRPGSAAALRACLDAEFDRVAHPLARNSWKLDAAGGLAEQAAEDLLTK